MIKKRYLVAGALSATLTACGADVHAPPSGMGAMSGTAGGTGGTTGGSGGTTGGSLNTGGTSSGTGGNSSGGGGTGGTGGSSGVAGSGGIASDCAPGIPATSQVPRMKDAAYDAVVNDLLGVTALATAGNVKPSALLSPDSDGSLDDISWNGYQKAAQTIAAEVMAGTNKAKFISCDGSSADCLTTTLKTFGRKAFRRPLTDTEVTSFMRLNSLTPKGTPDQVAQAMLTALLESPSFIMLPELGQNQDPASGALALTSYEIATRLSFMLWGSVPDDTLSAAADAGMLTTKDQILAQAQRMLKDPRAAGGVTSFLHYYAGITAGSHWVNVTTHDPNKYPTFTDASYTPAMAEMDSFYQDVVLNGGSFKDMFLSPNAFVNKDTAAIYGLNPASYGADLTKVTLDANQRPGFLTRAGFLSTFSHYDTTSPILRGAFIITKVLGIPLGTPPPGAEQTAPPMGDYMTMREEIDALTAPDKCKSCHHGYINPAGYVLEHYDSVGTWQDTDPLGGPIDGTGNVIVSADPNATPVAMSSPLDLMQAIAASDQAKFVYAQQLVAFATNRVPNPNDDCVVATLTSNMASDSYPLVNLIADYTQADSFRLRTVGK
ncbi:MAG TPA: DUF1592 domain-containing protein [Polyangiaceae bacterium]|nr:DUF1592 domain-containing protein [Polyangiaceae bacterium]